MTLIMEEPGTTHQVSPFSNLYKFSPSTETDTNSSTEADVHYPITTDHVYTGKHEIHLNKQVSEDNHSQDLFFSDDDLEQTNRVKSL